MKINRKIYFIATKNRPIRFISDYCSEIDELKDARIFNSEDEAKEELETFDDEVEFEVVEGEIIVDL